MREIQFSGELNIFNLYLRYMHLEKRDEFEEHQLAKYRQMVADINNLYKYSLSKDRILRETRWNEWVSLVNLETQRYLSVEQAADKLNKIKNI